jgi:hypothetical protein
MWQNFELAALSQRVLAALPRLLQHVGLSP